MGPQRQPLESSYHTEASGKRKILGASRWRGEHKLKVTAAVVAAAAAVVVDASGDGESDGGVVVEGVIGGVVIVVDADVAALVANGERCWDCWY